jgi:excisionase family DNA binding protein
MSMEAEVLTVEEAAKLLRVNRNTVYEAVARRALPHRRLGRRIIFSKAALLEWLAAGMRGASTPATALASMSPHPQPRTLPQFTNAQYTGRRSSEQIAVMKAQVLEAVEAAPGRGARDYAKATDMTTYESGPILGRLLKDGRLTKFGHGTATTYRPRTR